MRGRYLGLPLVAWIVIIVLAITCGGGVYAVSLGRTLPPDPVLPSAPPHAVVLGQTTGTDMLQGNFVLTTALYRTPLAPKQVVAFYRKLLKSQAHQFGNFTQAQYSILPADAPDALQNIPSLFANDALPTGQGTSYVYTQYTVTISDVGIAIDMRSAHGPTLVYEEMLTHPAE
jgi:hypothetical protein